MVCVGVVCWCVGGVWCDGVGGGVVCWCVGGGVV